MKRVFYPDRQKLITTAIVVCVIIASFALRAIPVQFDVFDLRNVPEFVVFVFGRIPIAIFDFLTNEAFLPRGDGFLVFPTAPQAGFAILFDLGVIYLASCVGCHLWRRATQYQS